MPIDKDAIAQFIGFMGELTVTNPLFNWRLLRLQSGGLTLSRRDNAPASFVMAGSSPILIHPPTSGGGPVASNALSKDGDQPVSTNQPGDEKLVAVFKHHAEKNPLKTKEAGRPIYDDVEIVEIHEPGSRNTYVFPSMVMSHWSQTFDGPVPVTYAERFSVQYRQFKAQQAQTISGTPLDEVPFLTEARKAELRALSSTPPSNSPRSMVRN